MRVPQTQLINYQEKRDTLEKKFDMIDSIHTTKNPTTANLYSHLLLMIDYEL